ncbi:MAG: hypothetical protein ABIK60_03250, partial [candidate division WOR-3 bacterium]
CPAEQLPVLLFKRLAVLALPSALTFPSISNKLIITPNKRIIFITNEGIIIIFNKRLYYSYIIPIGKSYPVYPTPPLPFLQGYFPLILLTNCLFQKEKRDLKNYQESIIIHQKEQIFICWVGYDAVKDVRK